MTSIRAAAAELSAASSPAIRDADRARYLDLLAQNPRALHRDGGAIHLTASAVVVDAPIEHVALLWHAKGQFWVQPGGHIEPADPDLESAARREVAEELGLRDLLAVVQGPALLHRHRLSTAFGACREHWDVQFLLHTPHAAAQQPLGVSTEAPLARWVPWPLITGGPARSTAHLPDGTVADMPGKLDLLAGVIAEGGAGPTHSI